MAIRRTVLIIDDEPNIQASFSSLLEDEKHKSVTAGSAEEAKDKMHNQLFDLILLDLNLPGQSGVEFLKDLKEIPDPPVVLVISGQSDIPTALDAIKYGAVDYLEKPVLPEKLISSVNSALMLVDANRQRNLIVEEIDTNSQIMGKTPAIKKLLKTIKQVAQSDSTVLVTGANGTGKELVATRLYLESKRRDKPFVKVNCPGIPSTLFESELFGHKKGSFTGAVKDYPGKFALADGGTIFLDEIGDLPLECQAKLLRVLETGEIETLGATDSRQVDVRVICATNQELKKLVSEGKFREDLYYRISVMLIENPSLNKRREDIPLLIGEFLRKFDPSGKTVLTPEALAYLTTLDYPGNVRQLKNNIERISILNQGQTVQLEDIAQDFTHPEEKGTSPLSLNDQLTRFRKTLDRKNTERMQRKHLGNGPFTTS